MCLYLGMILPAISTTKQNVFTDIEMGEPMTSDVSRLSRLNYPAAAEEVQPAKPMSGLAALGSLSAQCRW